MKPRFPGTKFASLTPGPVVTYNGPGYSARDLRSHRSPSVTPNPLPAWELPTPYLVSELPGWTHSQPGGCRRDQVYKLARAAIMAHHRWVDGLYNTNVLSHSSGS